MPDNWGFDAQEDLIYEAYARWEASGFSRIPPYEEIADGMSDWERSVVLFGRLVRFKRQWKEQVAALTVNNNTGFEAV